MTMEFYFEKGEIFLKVGRTVEASNTADKYQDRDRLREREKDEKRWGEGV